MKRAALSTILGRSIRLRCPCCGGGKLFRRYFRMYADCPNCKLHYERGPGYFLGSAYINYGLTTLLMTIIYVVCVLIAGFSNREVLIPLLLFVTVFPAVFFRYARSFWLGMDCYFDPPDADSAAGED